MDASIGGVADPRRRHHPIKLLNRSYRQDKEEQDQCLLEQHTTGDNVQARLRSLWFLAERQEAAANLDNERSAKK